MIKAKGLKQNPLGFFFGLEFMDDLHDYPGMTNNIRYYHRLKARIVKKFLKEHASKTKVFLDAGAGRGPYSVIGSELFGKVYCDEFDTKELSLAKDYMQEHKLKNVSFFNHNLTKTSYPDNSIDVIVCSEVLEHIPERERAAKELYRILKPGGVILISMPQRNSLFYRHVKKTHKALIETPESEQSDELWQFVQHLKFSAKDIEQIISNAGFRILGRSGANVLPVGEKIFSTLYSVPLLLICYFMVELILEKIFPIHSSFYFVEATKQS